MREKKNHKSETNNPNKNNRSANDKATFSRRVFIIFGLILSGFVALIFRAFYLQVKQNKYYQTKSKNNRVKLQVIPPIRGNIFDRNKVALSQNVLSYNLIVNRSKTKDLATLITLLPKYIRFDSDDEKKYNSEKNLATFHSDIIVRDDLSETEINTFLVNLFRFPGFDVIPAYKRYYPYGELTAHIVGYIQNINTDDQSKIDTQQYIGTKKIGRIGIEKYYESALHGQAGFRQAEFSSQGKIVRLLDNHDAIPGTDLYLTLDIKLQQIVTEELTDLRGAVVAIDPRNGEILAMVSYPTYNANLFVNGINQSDYQELINSVDKPLFNRALNGKYPPASTVKPLMALAALHYATLETTTEIECNGSYEVTDGTTTKRFHCWKRNGGHGKVNMHKAIVESCDVYYYTVGRGLGIDRIHDYFQQFGLGELTGIDLPNESTGILPNKEWKRREYNKNWYIGDTINSSIGQGYTAFTPLQMSGFMATLANQGKRYKPHLLKSYSPDNSDLKEILDNYQKPATTIDQNNSLAWNEINQALHDVVYSSAGSAHAFADKTSFEFSGKTGTAQVFSFKNNVRIKQVDLKAHLRDNAAFIAYAPSNKPEIAISVMIENGGGGSSVAAPIAVNILKRYFEDNDRTS